MLGLMMGLYAQARENLGHGPGVCYIGPMNHIVFCPCFICHEVGYLRDRVPLSMLPATMRLEAEIDDRFDDVFNRYASKWERDPPFWPPSANPMSYYLGTYTPPSDDFIDAIKYAFQTSPFSVQKSDVNKMSTTYSCLACGRLEGQLHAVSCVDQNPVHPDGRYVRGMNPALFVGYEGGKTAFTGDRDTGVLVDESAVGTSAERIARYNYEARSLNPEALEEVEIDVAPPTPEELFERAMIDLANATDSLGRPVILYSGPLNAAGLRAALHDAMNLGMDETAIFLDSVSDLSLAAQERTEAKYWENLALLARATAAAIRAEQ